VPPENAPGDEGSDAASAQLNDGLRSCRTVVRNYRALIAGDEGEGNVARDMIEPDPVDEKPAN
jgi:hypothetical protein